MNPWDRHLVLSGVLVVVIACVWQALAPEVDDPARCPASYQHPAAAAVVP